MGAGGVMVKWAADLEQTMGATEQLWDKNEKKIISWSEGANRSMGMTQNEALTSANRFNAMFKQIGAGEDTVADMSMGFTQLSADLSAMWGGSSIEASDALTSALRGNYEGLDKYNINLTEAMVNTEAMTIAVADGRDEITEADKVQARYNLITEQSADAQGQFGRETDTTAGKLAILRARVIDAGTKFGKLLLPYVNKAADALSKMVDWLENLNDTQRKWVLGIAAVAAALGPLLIIVGLMLPGIGALVAVISFLVSPIGLVVVAVAALAAGLIYAYTHFEGFRDIVDTVASTVKDVLVGAFDMAVDAFNKLKEAFQADGWQGVISTLGSMIMNGLSQVFNAIRNIDWGSLVQGGWNVIQGGIAMAWDAITSLDWSIFVPKLEWATWIVGKIDDFAGWVWGKISSYFPSANVITGSIGSFATWIWGKIGAYFPGTAMIVGSIAEFAGWVWGKISSYFPSSALIAGNKIVEFAGWIWSMISSFFPSSDLITGSIADLGEWLYEKIGAPKLSIPEWPGWSAFFDYINPLNDGGGSNSNEQPTHGNPVDRGRDESPVDTGNFGFSFDTKGGRDFVGILDAIILKMPLAASATKGLGASSGVLNTAMNLASTVTKGATSGITSSITSMASTGLAQFMSLQSGVTSQSSTANKNANSQFSSMATSAAAKFMGMQAQAAIQMALMAGSAKTQGSAMNTGMTGWMAGALARISVSLGQIPGIISGVGGRATNTAYEIGANISSAFAQGMRAYLGEIRNSAYQMVDAADTALRAKARISSPSKMFMQLGGYVGEGFERGILNSIPGVMDAASALVGAPGNVASPGFAGMGGSQVIQIITLEPGKWQEFLADAQQGGKFARNFGAELGMMEGVG